jgi:hypothetical protein
MLLDPIERRPEVVGRHRGLRRHRAGRLVLRARASLLRPRPESVEAHGRLVEEGEPRQRQVARLANAEAEGRARLVAQESNRRRSRDCQRFDGPDRVTDMARVSGLNDPRWALEVKPGAIDPLDDGLYEMLCDIQNGGPVIQCDR